MSGYGGYSQSRYSRKPSGKPRYGNYGNGYAGSYGGAGSYGAGSYGGHGNGVSRGHGSVSKPRKPTRAPTGRNAYGKPAIESNELWMGDLDPSWTESTISGFWHSMGVTPTNVKIIKDKANAAKSLYCFVTFDSTQTAAIAISKNGQNIPGTPHSLRLNWASGSTAKLPLGAAKDKGGQYTLLVGDLAPETSEQALLQKFSEKGNQVRSVTVVPEKGVGYVRFFSAEGQQRALKEMSGAIIGGRPIRVSVANPTADNIEVPDFDPVETARVHVAQSQPTLGPATDPNNTTIVLRGLQGKFSEDEIRQHVGGFGDLRAVKLSSDWSSATVSFTMRVSAEYAFLYLHGVAFNGCTINVAWGSLSEPYVAAPPIAPVYGVATRGGIIEGSERLPSREVDGMYLREVERRKEVVGSLFY